jgi:hypothetical protein
MLRSATRSGAKLFKPHQFFRNYTMPALQTFPDEPVQDLSLKSLPITTTTESLQGIADRHITKGIGRLRDHIFKEGRGLWVLTTVSRFLRLNNPLS